MIATTNKEQWITDKRNGTLPRSGVSKRKITTKPLGYDPGWRERQASLNLKFYNTCIDVMMNHIQGQDNRVDVKWVFEHLYDNVFVLKMYELNSTGNGMTTKTVHNEYFHIPILKDTVKSKGAGLKQSGTKTFLAMMTKANEELTKLGVKVLTRLSGEDEYFYTHYNPFTGKSVGSNPQNGEYLTYDEALNKGLPVDEIGTQGTYQEYHIDVEGWGDDWFERLHSYFQSYFYDSIDKDKISIELEYKKNGTSVPKNVESAIFPCMDTPYFNQWKSHPVGVTYDGITYPMRALLRLDKDNKEYQNIVNKFGHRLFVDNLYEKFGDNLIVVFVEKTTRAVLEIRKINTPQKGICEIEVITNPIPQIHTDIAKSIVRLLKKDGSWNQTTQSECKAIKIAYTDLFPIKKVFENDLRDQMVNILWGEKWPKGYLPIVYEALCEELNIPKYDYVWARKNISRRKLDDCILDIWIEENKHIIELKIDIPNNENYRQILTYAFLEPECKILTTMGNTKGEGYEVELVEKYTTRLNNRKNASECEFRLSDLSKFGLDIMYDEYVDAPTK
jgi:hypothetical protein